MNSGFLFPLLGVVGLLGSFFWTRYLLRTLKVSFGRETAREVMLELDDKLETAMVYIVSLEQMKTSGKNVHSSTSLDLLQTKFNSLNRSLLAQIDQAYLELPDESCIRENEVLLEILASNYDSAYGHLRELEEEFAHAYLLATADSQ